MPDVKETNRIYLTYKARIKSEAKLRLFSKLANFLIIWYSFWMIVVSIAQASQIVRVDYFEIILASSSVAIFASSVFLATGIIEKRAGDFRACYLELQKIYNSQLSEAQKMKRYADALTRYPNHSSRENADVILDTWRRGGTLYDTKGEIPLSWMVWLPAIIRKIVFWLITILLFSGPLCIFIVVGATSVGN